MSDLKLQRKGTKRQNEMKIKDVLSSAKNNFLKSTDQVTSKSPVKRAATPSPDKSKQLVESLLSPASLKKAGLLSSPPKKKPKLWKSKWQLATLTGGVTEKGKKKRASEASRLLDDEGVIHMLNRVPSVYGEVPVTSTSTNPRMARARTAASKQTKPTQPTRPKLQKVEKVKVKVEPVDEQPLHRQSRVSPRIKIEDTPPKAEIKDIKVGGMMSPRRVSRNLMTNALHDDLKSNLTSSQSEDYFITLRELPADLLDSVLSCDIRYSLPTQGLPKNLTSSSPSKSSHSAAAKPNHHLPPSKPNQPQGATKPPQSSNQHIQPVIKEEKDGSSTCSRVLESQPEASFTPAYPNAHQQVDRLADLRDLISNERTTPVKSPGAFSEVYVRLYENFAQLTISPSKTKLKGSLSPTTVEEIIQLLNFVASTRMYKAVILTGVGSVFCQGVDLLHLCCDNPETRRERAVELADAAERLVLALSSFPKVLVAAVNGHVTGLGLSLLPLCDLVYASEKATFNSYAARLGHIPEGGASFSLGHLNNPLINEMFLFGRHLTATELATAGLVSEVFLAGRLMEETIPRVRKGIAAAGNGMLWNKVLLKQNLKHQLWTSLPAETRQLTEMWRQKEFHRNLVHFINQEKSLHFQSPS